ncbi:hypothetical protein [Massilia sp. CCM 8734]|uniref:hypothetical protein n=1 Tax=Massilia sp. CCM 8734 TaxID=2609283 RepID=UPI00142323F1|nr:hypothetical protein [Massilia sp. CCM 8734]NIA00502.1 hypothetical protein [Massilia sp. CCM 8734]
MLIDEHILFDIIHRSLPGSERSGGYVKYANNVMTLYRNSFSNTEKARTGPEAWMYYAYDLDVFPVENVDLENQKALAKELSAIVEKVNGIVDLVAEFDM